MKKHRLIRATYPPELNVLLIILVFILTAFFSHHIFDVPFHEAEHRKAAYWGMFLIGIAAILVMLIVWEEILFPIKITELPNGIILSNHRLKLKIQLLLYLGIPAIFGFIYLRYDLNNIHFFLWFGVCMAIPVLTKLFSGIKNYNDFLMLTNTEIEYKNNDKEGFCNPP